MLIDYWENNYLSASQTKYYRKFNNSHTKFCSFTSNRTKKIKINGENVRYYHHRLKEGEKAEIYDNHLQKSNLSICPPFFFFLNFLSHIVCKETRFSIILILIDLIYSSSLILHVNSVDKYKNYLFKFI